MPSATRGDLFVLKTPFSAKKGLDQEEGYGAVSLTPCLVGQAYYCPESAFRNPGSIFMEESMKTF
jgi:hypothetical protein